jgi:hypothetical protein
MRTGENGPTEAATGLLQDPDARYLKATREIPEEAFLAVFLPKSDKRQKREQGTLTREPLHDKRSPPTPQASPSNWGEARRSEEPGGDEEDMTEGMMDQLDAMDWGDGMRLSSDPDDGQSSITRDLEELNTRIDEGGVGHSRLEF